jgi:pyruvate formate lyase activating enzyme
MDIPQFCSVCIRHCEIGHSFCQRRDRHGLLKDKNRFNAITVDYLFDKPITHFSENVKVLSIGSWGCNLRCLGCQNIELSWNVTGKGLGFREMKTEEIVDMAMQNDCKGICYTYNEPAILLEAVAEIASAAKMKDLFNVFVTNSTLTEGSVEIISHNIDAVAADIKSLRDEFYYTYCGADGIAEVAEKILHCIKAFYDSGCHVEVRTNIIPGGNDQEENYHNIAGWIRDNLSPATPWHITRFFPANKLSHLTPTSEESLLKAQKAGIAEGLENVYTYSDKGCDCAKESSLVKPSTHCCCNK